MATSRIDALIQAETAPAVYTHLTQERLNGQTVGAYMFNGSMLWWNITPTELDPLPPGARPLYVEGTDRG